LEIRARVLGQPLDVAAQLEKGVLGGQPRQGPDRGADRPGLSPPPACSPRLQARQILVIQVHLQGSAHDP
jgi:hypothetical protein